MTPTIKHQARLGRQHWRLVGAIFFALVTTISVWPESPRAQVFDSGSDGSDGALNVPANLGAIQFDPNDTARWGRVLDGDGDGVFNFTTIQVNGGTALVFSASKTVRPIHWLASGSVTITGDLSLTGANGTASTDINSRRQVAIPGAGGFSGGSGDLVGAASSPTPGDGPGGGAAAVLACAGSGSPVRCGGGGTFMGNRYLVPITGGSGGGGGLHNNSTYYGGGAGAGALLIASSTTLAVNGRIDARGGDGASNIGGGGSGGSIRLVAPTLSSNGNLLDVRGGSGSGSSGAGSAGAIRLERFTQIGTFNTLGVVATVGSPVDASTLRPTWTVRVTAISGIPVPVTAAGSFVVPDVSISALSAVPVDIEAKGIPPGTVVTLTVFPQSPSDPSVVNLPPVQATLTGTMAQSTATVNFAFPYGFSRGTLYATWTQ